MTAIVGVMNKHAVALAADSAVTIAGRKVMNSANKIFALSKYHPVAIAVYGNSELIGTPWEIIIKDFRKNLGDKSFHSLKEYVDAFFDFLKSQDYYTTEKEAASYINFSLDSFIQNLVLQNSPEEAKTILKNLSTRIKPSLNVKFTKGDKLYFNKIISPIIGDIVRYLASNNINVTEKELETALTYAYLNTIPPFDATGLIFTGYGEQEYFPVLINCQVGCVINKKLSVGNTDTVTISKDNPSSICPFAQTDVMKTILDGIAPQVQNLYTNTLEQAFNKIIDALVKTVEPRDAVLAQQISKLDISTFRTLYIRLSLESRQKEYTAPFVNSVMGLEKEDLADFAESLIKLTSIKRKVSMDQDSVGGPTDVMLISKGDGIIWKQRKHYFDKDLNHHFFENYYNQ